MHLSRDLQKRLAKLGRYAANEDARHLMEDPKYNRHPINDQLLTKLRSATFGVDWPARSGLTNKTHEAFARELAKDIIKWAKSVVLDECCNKTTDELDHHMIVDAGKFIELGNLIDHYSSGYEEFI